MERDQEDIAHPQNNPRILFTSPLPNGNSNPPPLVPIRLSNGESLPKRMRQEEINQRLTVCDNPNTSSSSTSSSTTWPLGSPQSHSPFLNLTVDVTSPGDEQTSSPSNHVPCSLSPQPSTSPRGLANLSDPASCNLVVPLSTSLRRTLLPNPVSRVIASVPSSGFSLPPPAVFDSQPSTSSSERSSEHSTSEPTSDSDRDATAPKNTQKYFTLHQLYNFCFGRFLFTLFIFFINIIVGDSRSQLQHLHLIRHLTMHRFTSYFK